jgi:hypothetical protein
MRSRALKSPIHQHGLVPGRVFLHPRDARPVKTHGSRNLAHAERSGSDERLNLAELVARERRLPSPVRLRTGVVDASPLGVFRRLRLCLGARRHKCNQAVPEGLLNGVLRAAVEREAVDHRFDDDALLHEGADGLHHVIIVAPEAVHPPDDQHVTPAQEVEQPVALFPLGEPGAHTRDAVPFGNHVVIVDVEASGPRLPRL